MVLLHMGVLGEKSDALKINKSVVKCILKYSIRVHFYCLKHHFSHVKLLNVLFVMTNLQKYKDFN